MPETTLSLEQRISRLEAIEEIRHLKAKYAHYLDKGFNARGIASLFAPDGEWVIEGQSLKGRDAIVRHCEKLSDIIPWSLHVLTTSTIAVDADCVRADCVFYIQSTQTMNIDEESDKAYLILGVFRDKCVKIDGSWFFAQVQADIQQSCLWTEGWVNSSVSGFFKMD